MRNITGPMATPFSSLMRFTDNDLFGVYVAPISVLMGGADAGRRGGEAGVGQAARPACRSWLASSTACGPCAGFVVAQFE